MNPTLRRDYADALGLETWVARAGGVPVDAPGAGVVPGEAPAARVAGSDWPQLRTRVAACTRCSLCKTRTQTVFGVGNPHAEWLVVGEAPGADEDRQGEPFVGRAGQLLNSMLRAIGLAREQVYIANILKCRPPGNRDPTAGEAAECMPYLEQQIALLKPKIMLAVGRIAAQILFLHYVFFCPCYHFIHPLLLHLSNGFSGELRSTQIGLLCKSARSFNNGTQLFA